MHDNRFVAAHRGGPLLKEDHIMLIRWSVICVKHVMSLYKGPVKELTDTLLAAEAWADGRIAVGEARKASVRMLKLARELNDPASVAITRAAGHAVATAHMADHSMGGALYSLKAVKISGGSVAEEKIWQNNKLPPEIRELAISSRTEKERAMKLM